MKKSICFIILLVFVGFILFPFSKEKDNYYEFVNRDIFKENHLKEGEYSWSLFQESQDEADALVVQIVENILKNNDYDISDHTRNLMKIVYENSIDMEKRNRVGLGPLKKYIDTLMNSSNVDDYQKIGILIEQELGVPIFGHMVVETDFYNQSKNIIYFYPMTLAFGSSSDMFVDDDYMVYKAYIKRAMNQILKVYGYEKKEASSIVNKLISFYEEIGSHSFDSHYYEDMSHYYHVVSLDSLKDIYSHVDMDNYLKKRLGNISSNYSVVDEGQMKFFNNYFIDENLEIWKYYGVMQILSFYANYLGDDYVEVVSHLKEAISLEKKGKSLEENAKSLVADLFSDEIDVVFSKEVIREDDIKYLENLFSDIKDVFEEKLRNNTWLSNETKDKAVNKLRKMKLFIGKNFANDEYNMVFKDDSLVDNMISYQQELWQKELKRLSSSTMSKVMNESVVNAFYRPQNNSVMIPSAFFYLMKDDMDDFTKLGSIGMILAHEVTHGFDGNGSLFDEDGNYANWWTDSDRKSFLEKKQLVSEYYSKYEVLEGRKINGEGTANENIADLGALSILVGIAENKNATSNDFKKMFSSFASLWASQEEDHYLKLLLLSDTHSPNQFRVNAVLSSTDKFYDIYHIYPWNKMYVYSSDRVKVW